MPLAHPLQDQSLHGLELRGAGALEEFEQRRLDRGHDRARAGHPLERAIAVELVAGADRVGGHMNLDPLLQQVIHRLCDADVGLDPAHDRLIAPVQGEALGARGGEDRLLDPPLVLQADLRRGVAEALRILLADESGNLEYPRGLQERCARAGHAPERRIASEPLLDVDDDQHRPVAVQPAHQAAAIANARSR
jgi:hypothetical protein